MWFLTQDIYDQMHSHEDLQIDAQAVEAFSGVNRSGGDRIYSVSDGVASIEVQGVLTSTPNIMAELFGGGNTTYGEITAAIARAESDPKVNSVNFLINSGGGHAAGVFDVMAQISDMTKPTTSIVDGLAASAAYGIASQANEIVATRPTDTVGSIGVAVTMFTDDDVVTITSTNAPNKRPDPTTEEGRAVIQAQLDELETEFINTIAAGRNVSAETVKSDFGRGGTMIAKKALAPQVIDRILTNTDQRPANTAQEANAMDLKTLKAEHPELCDQLRAEGASEAREIVEAHLELGKAGGEAGIALAMEAIAENKTLGPKLTAQYQIAAMNKSQQDARTEDEKDATVEGGKPQEPQAKDFETQVHEAIFANVGIDLEDK